MGNIKELIKSYSIRLQNAYESKCIPTDEEGYWNINVVFMNNDNKEDETQFDIKPHNFDYGAGRCKELEELWKDFCKENRFKQNSVTEIYIPNI